MIKKRDKIITNEQENKGKYLPSIKNPHNDFFIAIFSRKDKTIEFFKKYLPKSILAIIDLSSLEVVDSKHMLELGINLYNDLLFKCSKKDNPGLCYIVFEAQSTMDPEMVFRFLSYDVAIIRKHRSQNHEKIPVLMNVLFFSGESAWKESTSLDDYYHDPATDSQYLHLAPFSLISLSADINHPDYVDQGLGYILASFYCGRKRNNAYKEFKKFKEISAFNTNFDSLPKSERILVGAYIGSFAKTSKELEKIVLLIITNQQEKEEFMQTIAQQYEAKGIEKGIEIGIEKGMEKGIEKGMEKGIEKVAKNMLSELHLDIDTVQKATKLSRETIQKLLK